MPGKRISGHSARGYRSQCICGWQSTASTKRGWRNDYAAHLIEMRSAQTRICADCGGTKDISRMSIPHPWICKPCSTVRIQAWAAEHPDQWDRSRRASHLRRHYGITIEQFDTLLASQGGGCAICGSNVSDKGRRFHVDHAHDSGRVRGILCGRCNRAMGQFNDDATLCENAAQYLRRGHLKFFPVAL